ncbi:MULTISPECIES: hypothetical protein [unclassified Leucobacter]|uniref:hypothetical protein n=1 Tax=unclassified Leucobacter TaxID=2621730 RepID=UPI000A4C630A|nr:hypothetical protein [Leucobacter sp. Ag1]
MSSGTGEAGPRGELPRGLADDPFDYRVTKSGEVRITRGGHVVTVLGGAAGERLAARLGVDPVQDQLLLAKATGNYRRGNERR